MSDKGKFWLCALGPFVVFGAGLSLAGDWVLFDAFVILCITSLLLSVHFWRRAFRLSHGGKTYAALAIPSLGSLLALGGCVVGYPLLLAIVGCPWAQYRMAEYEEMREIVEKNWKPRADAAERWYQKAAEAGYAPAQFRMFVDTQGSHSQDHWKWLQSSANQGYSIAEESLGEAYERGEEKDGLPLDKLKAAQWYRKAAEHGDCTAMNKVSSMYQDGWGGVEKDIQQAAKWDQTFKKCQTEINRLVSKETNLTITQLPQKSGLNLFAALGNKPLHGTFQSESLDLYISADHCRGLFRPSIVPLPSHRPPIHSGYSICYARSWIANSISHNSEL
jgi:hypothetical protein